MTVKSNFNLDKRINSIDDIQTIIHNDHGFIGCKGFFFDEFIQTKDLSKCRYGELIDITTHDDRNDLCFKAEYEEGLVGFYRFFLPEAVLEPVEKKYRPYSLNEFLNQYHLGDEIVVRRKLNKDRRIHKLFTEYGGNDDTVHLGTYWFTFKDLYDNYEIYTDKGWQPFGVIVEEDE